MQGSRSRDRVKAQKLLLEYTKHQIAEHEETFDENNLRDFVDLYIQSCKEDGEKNTQGTYTHIHVYIYYMRLKKNLFSKES